ncbi:metallophosphoesterase [uncultured Oscillibacter sp.]|uniref:metallophosphoesterase family protein n=1 Tax=uncultured Oscillibacter sp. TaxID=876091 RepID=UPI00260CC697|nr:metallophosphoesterase [uncultured Oscillibacter sp.]
MIFYYGFDREFLNTMNLGDKSPEISKKIEQKIEEELRNLIFLMPLGERIVISPTFRFESPICRRIIAHNREFIENGYLAQYMRENTEIEFREKKAERYAQAMQYCDEYRIAYCDNTIYQQVNGIWMYRIPKKESVGLSSRKMFTIELQRVGANLEIPQTTIDEIISVIQDISDEVFLWEVVEHELLERGIPWKVIRDLRIRERMNQSYLDVFNSQDMQIPFHSIVNGNSTSGHSIYDMWKIDCIFRTLGINTFLSLQSNSSLLKLHESIEIQEFLQIIRNGLSREKNIQTICEDVQKAGNILEMALKITSYGGISNMEIKRDILREDTLKLLHISDLHLTNLVDMKRHFQRLKIDLHHQLSLRRLDYLIVSGDICHLPCEEQYTIALQFFRDIIAEFGLSLDKVIFVVGNHDCDWELSKKAYDETTKTFREGDWIRRFETYNKYFYFPLFGRNFSMELSQQIERCQDDINKLYIVGFNSSNKIDHINRKASSINEDALLGDNVGEKLGDDYIKLAVWHHPISGNGAIEDKTFMDTLAILGYGACFHGHIHEATKEHYDFDDSHTIKMIGAGTLGAPQKGRGDGIPLQYNLIEIDLPQRELTIHTRKREKADGAWVADARWGDKNKPKAYYSVKV